MSARKINVELLPCVCGEAPTNHVEDAGEARIFWISCDCGARTEKSDSYPDVLAEWNEKAEVQPRK